VTRRRVASIAPNGVARVGEPHAFRVRVGDFRIVYEVFDDRTVVQVIRIGHRRNIYRS
jgi:mRNA interferase RelE/StbE